MTRHWIFSPTPTEHEPMPLQASDILLLRHDAVAPNAADLAAHAQDAARRAELIRATQEGRLTA